MLFTSNTMYLFEDGAISTVDQVLTYTGYTSSWNLIAIYNPSENRIYLGWDASDRFGFTIVDCNLKKVVAQSYTLTLTYTMYILGFDGDLEHLTFVEPNKGN